MVTKGSAIETTVNFSIDSQSIPVILRFSSEKNSMILLKRVCTQIIVITPLGKIWLHHCYEILRIHNTDGICILEIIKKSAGNVLIVI